MLLVSGTVPSPLRSLPRHGRPSHAPSLHARVCGFVPVVSHVSLVPGAQLDVPQHVGLQEGEVLLHGPTLMAAPACPAPAADSSLLRCSGEI